MKLTRYDIMFEYLPGKELHIADYLSRNFLPSKSAEEESCMKRYVLSINATDENKKRIQLETAKDEILKLVLEQYKVGWPSHD